MMIVEKISLMKELSSSWKNDKKIIGLVPTMGCLHEGHLSLIRKSCEESDITAVSIFVNPAQFGSNEDFNSYPKVFEKDCGKCEKEGVDVIFYPSAEEMYPQGFQTSVSVKNLQKHLCGLARPGHFDGVATVVLKLFNIVSPDRAYFGEKDYQQLQIIKKMTTDLNLDVAIVPMPIVREPDGVAMSSRNRYLAPDERKRALLLQKILKEAERLILSGEKDRAKILSAMYAIAEKNEDAVVDYISICDTQTLEDLEIINRDVLLAAAVKIGEARLIDNLVVKR